MAGRNFVASAAVRVFALTMAVESLWYRPAAGGAAWMEEIAMASNEMEHRDLRTMWGILSVASYFVVREHGSM